VGGASSTYGEVHTGHQRGKLSEREKLEDLGLSERIIVKWVFKKEYGVEWLYLAQNKVKNIRL
jgi:hypothetical protein